ncbi:hypothetical protein BDA96_03G383500 [Sorghum bicolor]|uniref:Bowman-Birk serine protease inhibitors family domain-containing protein n=2 Tax=Sorghum bicolor TaxID=4558 RepID=A0A921USJ8_SORBI|nr:Bowman-Birk type trypsin inhibitor [Sorghum bicolor]EES03878.1 hypothetical protein SORBI_3003G355700 [Sorghum bicolor]KAG0540146.1 hypothetical protein BDA96_03G383500 [Sorghum bicolor]|eukprot:XP_002458758.1 Bowman-Birk type trypsin inhibitor [Sorghum bicolor]
MRLQVLLVTLGVLAVLAALPLSKGEEEGGAARAKGSWPCCDKCGFCYRSFPPRCQCLDFSQRGCHPACRSCLKFTTGGIDEPPIFRCADILVNFCDRSCTPPEAL